MEETCSRELDELRALVAACTPVQVFGVLAFLWNEAAHAEGADASNVELFTCAAEAARDAAGALMGEDSSDDEGEGGETDDGEEPETDDADATTAPSSADGGEALSAEPDAPASAHETTAREEDPAAVGAAATTTTCDEDTTMARDARLGMLPQGATTWRVKRAENNRRAGPALLWDDNGVAVAEWPVRSLSARTILDRWGPGAYVIQYITEEGGKRRPCGTSRLLHISGPKEGPTEVTAPPPAAAPTAPATATSAPPAAPSSAPPFAPHAMPPMAHGPISSMLGAPPGDPMLANVAWLMTYMTEQNERARAQAAAEARIAAERYRAELDAQLERERIASQERIALAQAQAQVQAKAARAAGPLDPDALAEKIGAVVGARIQEAREEEYDDEDDTPPAPVVVQAPPAAPPDNTATIVNAVKETISPIVGLLAQFLQNQAQANANAANAQRLDHAAE